MPTEVVLTDAQWKIVEALLEWGVRGIFFTAGCVLGSAVNSLLRGW